MYAATPAYTSEFCSGEKPKHASVVGVTTASDAVMKKLNEKMTTKHSSVDGHPPDGDPARCAPSAYVPQVRGGR